MYFSGTIFKVGYGANTVSENFVNVKLNLYGTWTPISCFLQHTAQLYFMPSPCFMAELCTTFINHTQSQREDVTVDGVCAKLSNMTPICGKV